MFEEAKISNVVNNGGWNIPVHIQHLLIDGECGYNIAFYLMKSPFWSDMLDVVAAYGPRNTQYNYKGKGKGKEQEQASLDETLESDYGYSSNGENMDIEGDIEEIDDGDDEDEDEDEDGDGFQDLFEDGDDNGIGIEIEMVTTIKIKIKMGVEMTIDMAMGIEFEKPIEDDPKYFQLLDGLNYVRWAQSVKLFVGGRGKIGFLLGTEKEPVKSDPKYAKWFSDDSMVRTWLINSMQSTISAGYLFTNNAHLIWESLRKVYYKRENNARIFQLSNEIENFKQGTQTLGMYYARLRSSWEELSHYDSFIEWPASAPSDKVPIPPTAAEIYAKIVEKTRSRRSPMPLISGIPSETSVMAIRYAYPAPPSVPSQTSHTSSPNLSPLPTASGDSHPSRKKCDYCDSSTFSALSQDEISRFQQLLSMSSTPAASNASNFASTNSVFASPTSPWIADSGATDNMTGMLIHNTIEKPVLVEKYEEHQSVRKNREFNYSRSK
ncbi:hypothetical protein GIB67_042409 [Kingdonia uniflora]|uniref:Retrotransposon gag domain-containing protein n=1 Tax=Kingdonia uniflora TaxID=39325 RepID=A0A7J7M8G0_9MAGN|nr:hypothetical protein GIB67_042409 [Kingdonia uniflora]